MSGQLSEDGHRRRCAEHGEHALLYPCPEYSPEVLEEIRIQSAQFVANLRDPEWCERQVANGLPAIGIAIYRVLAGIEPESVARSNEQRREP